MLLTLHTASFSLGHAGAKINWLHPLLCKGQVSSRRSSFSFSMVFSLVFLAWLSGFLGCGCTCTLFHGFLNGCCRGLSAAVFKGFLCFFSTMVSSLLDRGSPSRCARVFSVCFFRLMYLLVSPSWGFSFFFPPPVRGLPEFCPGFGSGLRHRI